MSSVPLQPWNALAASSVHRLGARLQEMVNPDFVKFAESFHCEGLRCLTKAELPEKMAHFLASENVRTAR